MAKQDRNPPPWTSDMSDGCSGVCDFWWTKACQDHDEAYHYGGSIEDKLIADGDFYEAMCNTPGVGGWVARHGWAKVRYDGVRRLTYNYPPGHFARHGFRAEAWNWESGK